jgi:precorrin-6Y C5,15-methyltransferase (decarboxylating)
MSSNVTVIGYDGSALPSEALAAIAAADLVVGGRRHLDAIETSARTVVMGPLQPAIEALGETRSNGGKAVVIASGDPGFFGIVRKLRTQRIPLTVLPARSSVARAFARLGLPWDDALVVSAHGRPIEPALNILRRYGRSQQPVAVLTDDHSSPARIIEALGSQCPVLLVFERLGESDERITRIGPEDHDQAKGWDWQSPNLVVTAEPRIQGHPPWLQGRRGYEDSEHDGWGLPDEAFQHRDGMITKREVRAVVLSRLAPRIGTLVWDVGAGSGSVAVECARLGAAAIAVEREPDRNSLRRNALDWNVQVVEGSAPAALQGLPYPDAVFIGGGGPEVVTAVAAIQPSRIVVAVATLERVGPTLAALGDYEVDTVLLQASHLQPLGDGHRLVPANPVFVVSGVLS